MKTENKEVLFLKYLDGEMTYADAAGLEKMLDDNPEQKQLFEAVKKKRLQVFDAMKSAYPEAAVEIPEFVNPTAKAKNKSLPFSHWVRYAAVLALLLTFSMVYYFMDFSSGKSAESEIAREDISQSTKYEFETLNYYISPNRCWHNRQMTGSFTEI